MSNAIYWQYVANRSHIGQKPYQMEDDSDVASEQMLTNKLSHNTMHIL